MISLVLLMLLGFVFAVIPAPVLLSLALLLNLSVGVQPGMPAAPASEAPQGIVLPH